MSFIIPFSQEPDDELYELNLRLQQKAFEINNGIRSIDQANLTEEELRYLYELDMISFPKNIRPYLLTNADDSSRLLGAAADYMGALPAESEVKQSLSSLLDSLIAWLGQTWEKYLPPSPPDNEED